MAGGQVGSVDNLNSAQGELSYHSVYQVYGSAPTRQEHSIPIAVSGNRHTRKLIN